jgi:hypothetical protein
MTSFRLLQAICLILLGSAHLFLRQSANDLIEQPLGFGSY